MSEAWRARLGRRWWGWWLSEGSPAPLAAFRALFGAAVALEAWLNQARAPLYTPETFHLPYVAWVRPLPQAQIEALFWVELGCALCVCVGLLGRWAALGALLTQGYAFLICQLNFRNHVYLELLLLALLVASPASRAWSVDALLRRAWWRWRGDPARGEPPRAVLLTTQRLIVAQLAVVYGYAALHKLSPGFLSGYPLGDALARAAPRGVAAQALLEAPQREALGRWLAEPRWSQPLSWLTVAAELFLAVGLLWRPARPAAVFVGVGFHFMIGLGMDIYTFGLVMCAGYVCAWAPRSRPLTWGGER
jgi:uncharacterized membrane protein YphA (DoxX/SURF4 family)